jgi:hypothetical protein
MMSGDGASMPRPRARKDEVIMFTQRISRGESGKMGFPSVSERERARRRRRTCAVLVMRRCRRNWGHQYFGCGLSNSKRIFKEHGRMMVKKGRRKMKNEVHIKRVE